VELVVAEGLSAMDTRDESFLTVALVPTTPGSMSIDLVSVRAIEEWANEMGANRYGMDGGPAQFHGL
jgi:hypothetical protein